jgi:DNA-binding transcriptional ArsR family regulator
MQGLTWVPPLRILHHMVKDRVDDVATAVASAPRRAIIERLAEGETSMSVLADHLAVTLPAVDKHLRVLLDAGVVRKEKTGRTTSVRLVPGSLEELGTWAMRTRLMWGHALDRLEQHLSTDPEEKR